MSVVNLKYCVGVSEVFKDSASDEAEAEFLIHASQSDDPFKNKNNLAKLIPDQNSPKTEVPKKRKLPNLGKKLAKQTKLVGDLHQKIPEKPIEG